MSKIAFFLLCVIISEAVFSQVNSVVIYPNDNALNSSNNEYLIEAELKDSYTFNLLQLQENISKGQRVGYFVFEIWNNGNWQKIAEGTTIGYERIVPFNSVAARKVWLRILSSRLEPNIAEMGLFFYGG